MSKSIKVIYRIDMKPRMETISAPAAESALRALRALHANRMDPTAAQWLAQMSAKPLRGRQGFAACSTKQHVVALVSLMRMLQKGVNREHFCGRPLVWRRFANIISHSSGLPMA